MQSMVLDAGGTRRRVALESYKLAARAIALAATALSIRLCVASFTGSEAPAYASCLFFSSGFYMGWRHGGAALYVLLFWVPLLMGASAFGVISLHSGLIFCWAGTLVGCNIRQASRPNESTKASVSSITDWAIVILGLRIFWSLLVQISSDWNNVIDLQRFNPIEFDYADPAYFYQSSFVWLLGISSYFHFRDVGVIRPLCRPLLYIYAVTIGLFVVLQAVLNIPERLYGIGFTSPFEDIASFGAVAAAMLALSIFSLGNRPSFGLRICSLCFVLAVVCSWSRAAWVAGVIVVVISVLRTNQFGWRYATLITVVLLGASASLSTTNARFENPYLARLASLVRFEPIKNKSNERIFLYTKAIRMIKEHPISGFGMGSFYLTSRNYASINDPRAETPNFAHNAIIQVAAELGLPSAVLLSIVFLSPLVECKLWGFWGMQKPNLRGGDYLQSSIYATGLFIYCVTQSTSNSLNIYPSHQILFWALVALARSCSISADGPIQLNNGIGKI